MFEIGINSNNECGNSITEVYHNIKQAGFNNVMVAFKSGKAEESIKEALNQGLKIPYIHLDTKFANDLWAKGTSNLEFVKSIINQIKLCAKYDIRIAVMHGAEGTSCDMALPPNKNAINSMKKILKAAEKYNVKIALENLDRVNFNQFLYLLDNIDSEWLGLCYDAGHHYLYNADFDILEKYGKRILAIHLHDNLMDYKFGYDFSRDLHRLPFDGKLDYNIICKKLANTPYNNVIMLELHKQSCGKPFIYDNVDIKDYLKSAKTVALKIARLIEKYRK